MHTSSWKGFRDRPSRAPVGALALLLLASACTESGPSAAPRALGSGFPLRVALADGGELVLPEAPRRLVPANAGVVDVLVRLVEPGRVAALPTAALSYSMLAEDAGGWGELPTFEGFLSETLIALSPDLVLAHRWQSPETMAVLRSHGVPVLTTPLPRTWNDIEDQLALLGAVVGEEERARSLAAELEARRAALAQRTRGRTRESALSYSNLGSGGWAAGAGTTADLLLGLAGLSNAAGEAGHEGHVSLDLEGILTLDPDWIVVGTAADEEGRSPTEVYLLGEPALRGLRAIREGRVIALPPRLFTTSSIELVTGAEVLAGELEARR